MGRHVYYLVQGLGTLMMAIIGLIWQGFVWVAERVMRLFGYEPR